MLTVDLLPQQTVARRGARLEAVPAAAAADAPVYPTLTAPQVLYILNDSDAKVAFVSPCMPSR